MNEILFPRLLGRLEFFLRSVAVFVLGRLLIGDRAGFDWIGAWIFTGLAVLLAVYHVLFIVLPRIRDAELPVWTVVLVLIPFVNLLFGLFLLLYPRTPASIR